MAASPSTRTSSSTGRKDIVRIRCVSKAATARRIRIVIREGSVASVESWHRAFPVTLRCEQLLSREPRRATGKMVADHSSRLASLAPQDDGERLAMTHLWPWLAIAGLGAFHGINPAMGWLFAVALAMHRKSRRVLWLSLVPSAIGHAASVAAVVFAVVTLGLVVDRRLLEIAAGIFLLSWAVYFAIYGHRHRVRIGMQASMTGLGVWSFLMATAHGAGLMLVP